MTRRITPSGSPLSNRAKKLSGNFSRARRPTMPTTKGVFSWCDFTEYWFTGIPSRITWLLGPLTG